ncbi:ABC transporter ATP-binding protein [Roseospira goensis]|uniref:sn-glycerol 3-phosphate transport system ATP-binding protein/multiple sugar transport system ATP-binding protein n=1 Tax=Roseospira goensis TaxID=391922 RepID=A0A7W6S0A3_9PROT|nr:sn-glycerol-3-phosphate ABC transporter ATP-binding protein UgpC [Roseospira goensis]MBB4285909.1 sn-glycerol 3-phosphate transport system ATP-binding protein/multiple sugar transport system ATP-binding protein [Roseospira goensis]
MASIELRGVSKRYPNGLYGVRDIDLKIRDGEFVIFLGPSGCGKSTTLRLIAGLESVTSGDLLIGDQSMVGVPPRDRDVAVVFQSYALYPHMTVAANMAFGLKMRKMPRREIATRVDRAADLLGLSHLLTRKPAALSGGQRQRVALGRAIVREPKVFLFDEPLSNLDAQLRAEMRLELVKLHRRLGRTIIHVTHDQIEAMTMGDRICIMREGRLIQSGPPLEVYANPVDTFVARFLSSPPMNLLPAHLEVDGDGLTVKLGEAIRLAVPERHVPAYRAVAGRPVTFGLRPEDIHEQPPAPTQQGFEVQVVALEALGAETNLVAQPTASGALPEITARLGRQARARTGETVTLYPDLLSMHLFDPETGAVIPRPPLDAPR